jgi:hypothetical protein
MSPESAYVDSDTALIVADSIRVDLEVNPLGTAQRLVPIHLDVPEANEVPDAVISVDPAEALLVAERLHRASHAVRHAGHASSRLGTVACASVRE